MFGRIGCTYTRFGLQQERHTLVIRIPLNLRSIWLMAPSIQYGGFIMLLAILMLFYQIIVRWN
jgi:hypothetical protein